MRWVAWNLKSYPELALLYAIPNGGQRNRIVAAKLKAEGVKAGVPDLNLAVARGGYHGLYIEMKVKPNKPTKKQLEWHEMLREQGYRVEVCYGWEEGVAVLKGYLK
ncbi:MAG: VRR-NUC domain-containing protein [Deltaproteobacteria bacterium]|nr:VRR-NUC domain-containing protein [Deltaproteobacteria bacterium]